MGFTQQAKLVVKHTFLEYVHPDAKQTGRRLRAFTDTAILEGSGEDVAATHCKAIDSKVPEAAASLASLAVTRAAKDAAEIAELVSNSTCASTSSPVAEEAFVGAASAARAAAEAHQQAFMAVDPHCMQWWGPGYTDYEAQMMQYGGFAMAPAGPVAMDAHGNFFFAASQDMADMGNMLPHSVPAMGDMAPPSATTMSDMATPSAPAPPVDSSATPSAPSGLRKPPVEQPPVKKSYAAVVAGSSAAKAKCATQSSSSSNVWPSRNADKRAAEVKQAEEEAEHHDWSWRPSDEPVDPRTTIMLRNLPNNYTCDMLLDLLDSLGFSGRYDLVYLPVDFSTGAGLGYAFVNLVTSGAVADFWQCFSGFCKWVVPSDKVCSVTWSHPHQGLAAHVERYRNSPVMHPAVPGNWKPVLFESGVRVAFPPPTKKLKAPRIKCMEDM